VTTKKQKRAAALARREAYMEELRFDGLVAQEANRSRSFKDELEEKWKVSQEEWRNDNKELLTFLGLIIK